MGRAFGRGFWVRFIIYNHSLRLRALEAWRSFRLRGWRCKLERDVARRALNRSSRIPGITVDGGRGEGGVDERITYSGYEYSCLCVRYEYRSEVVCAFHTRAVGTVRRLVLTWTLPTACSHSIASLDPAWFESRLAGVDRRRRGSLE